MCHSTVSTVIMLKHETGDNKRKSGSGWKRATTTADARYLKWFACKIVIQVHICDVNISVTTIQWQQTKCSLFVYRQREKGFAY